MASPSLPFSKSLPTNDSIPKLALVNRFSRSTLHLSIKFKSTHKNPKTLDQYRRLGTKTRVSFLLEFLTKTKDAKAIKEELLDAIAEDQQRIDQLTRKLEAMNPTREPLKSDLLNGKWELIYTTSKSILQTERPKFLRSRVNYQAINLDTLRAQNMETWPFFNQVTADLMPLSSRKVAVKFDYFRILGLIPIKAPERAQYGSLEITYLDEDLRISRGDKGNLFILKMVDRSYKVPSS